MGKNLKKLTILHSNDFHGDFLAEQVDETLIGGVSYLSGYVNKVRNEEKNVIYASVNRKIPINWDCVNEENFVTLYYK